MSVLRRWLWRLRHRRALARYRAHINAHPRRSLHGDGCECPVCGACCHDHYPHLTCAERFPEVAREEVRRGRA